MDASEPRPSAPPVERNPDSYRSISGYLLLYSHGPVSWGAQHQTLTALSSCEAEIIATNETVKSLLELKILFRNLNLPLTSLVPVYNDNKVVSYVDVPYVRDGILSLNLEYSDGMVA